MKIRKAAEWGYVRYLVSMKVELAEVHRMLKPTEIDNSSPTGMKARQPSHVFNRDGTRGLAEGRSPRSL